MITRNAMTIKGFEYLLRTHGLEGIQDRIIGHLREDLIPTDRAERSKEIDEWLSDHPEVEKYIVIDDEDYDLSRHPFVKTDGTKGLIDKDIIRVLELLN